jgi:hypothetical protein
MKGVKISENDRCMGEWNGVKCMLSPRWFVKTDDGLYRCPECKTLWRKLQDGTYKMVVSQKEMFEYLQNKGWIIKVNSAYQPEDIKFKIPYDVEGTYDLYIKCIYKGKII